MRRRTAALLLATLTLSGLLVASGQGWSYSDGVAGSSGAIPENLRKCAEIGRPGPDDDYCIVQMPDCGSCHGSLDDMRVQEGSKPSPSDSIKVEFKINGLADTTNLWTYRPGQTFRIDIQITDVTNTRPAGEYAAGGFNLNASAGALSCWTTDAAGRCNDPNVRITGGVFQHAGSQNPDAQFCPQPGQCRPHGQTSEDESPWAGEATHTAKGSDVRQWVVRWTAPSAAPPPRGAALVMMAMIPDGDGLDNCVRVNCTPGAPYEPQARWDWYRFMFPRRILCQEGAYDSKRECEQAVLDYVLPKRPPLNTACEYNPQTCPDGTRPEGGTPVPASLVWLAVLVAAGAWSRRR